MSGRKQFDETEAVDAAMMAFWRHGYDGTSVHDTVRAAIAIEFGLPQRICLTGAAPQIESVTKLLDGEQACENMAVADLGSVYGGESLGA